MDFDTRHGKTAAHGHAIVTVLLVPCLPAPSDGLWPEITVVAANLSSQRLEVTMSVAVGATAVGA